jgi:hypothetical protein
VPIEGSALFRKNVSFDDYPCDDKHGNGTPTICAPNSMLVLKLLFRIAVIFLVFAAYSPLTLRSQFQESTPLAVRHS